MGRALTKQQQKRYKRLFLDALEESSGIITPAAKAIGISLESIRLWRQKDPEFDAAVIAVGESAIDIAETALMKNIKAGDTQAIKFFLATKGRSRGYAEKTTIEGELTVNRPRVVYEDSKDAHQTE